ncbi:hypothetical protein HMN09_00873500 [Mycena chlorophos]|uniref:Uncharacterized protein n=1 Tax=Mycena chlorophos TaxID=658473 RepID=A0A8H6SML9_MYCCL|nr:hypothetical protein HMN09_00873500 [Mycena chlorophos]
MRVPPNWGTLGLAMGSVSLTEFLLRVPPVLELSNGLTVDLEAGVDRHYFHEPGHSRQAVFYISGKIVGEESTTDGEFIILREPDGPGLYTAYREAVIRLQEHMAGSQPSENLNVTGWTYSTAPKGSGPGPTVRVRTTNDTELSSLQFDAGDGFAPGHKEDDCLAIGAHVRCAVRMFREDRVCVECEDGNVVLTAHWVLDAEQVARCYSRAERGRRAMKRVIHSDNEEEDDATPVAKRPCNRQPTANNDTDESDAEHEEESDGEENEEIDAEAVDNDDGRSEWSRVTQRSISPEL